MRDPRIAELLKVMAALAGRYEQVYERDGAVVVKELGSINMGRPVNWERS